MYFEDDVCSESIETVNATVVCAYYTEAPKLRPESTSSACSDEMTAAKATTVLTFIQRPRTVTTEGPRTRNFSSEKSGECVSIT